MVATVKIKVPPCDGNPAGEVIINETDYDPKVHQLVGAEVAPPKVEQAPVRKGRG